MLARLLANTRRRTLIVVSFRQAAVDRFHELGPRIDVAPGLDGAANWLLAGGSPGDGVVAFQVPIAFRSGDVLLDVTTAENVARAHREGYAWQNWFSSDDSDAPATWHRLIDMCVDGTMTSRPGAYERVLRGHVPPPPAVEWLLSRGSAARRRPSAFAPLAVPPGAGGARAS